MDETALQANLSRIERRQRLMLILLVVPYVLLVAHLLGYWKVGVVVTAAGLAALAVGIGYRRRNRSGTGG
ncbi:hypothetical protein ACKVMT_07125 [Halobacteriales archaeon Cl-PHB]